MSPEAALPPPPPPPRGLPDALSEQLLLTMMQEISRDAVLSVDPAGRVTSWNQGAEELLGYRADEALGRQFGFLLPPDLKDGGEIERLIEETEHRGFLRDYETRRITKDGREIHISLTRMRRLDENGNLLGATAILHDITARKQMEHELVRASTLAAIGEFAARIAHEVRNPLTGMSSAMSLLAGEFPAEHPHGEIFEEVQDQIRRVDRVLDDLLTFARHRPVDRQQIDLVQLLEKVVRLIRAAGDLDGVTVHRSLPAEARVAADPTMFEDSFFNLIQNAAQAMRSQADAELRLSVESVVNGFRVTVRDNGPGVPADLLEKIFDPFFTTKAHGTGLGLPITKKHIEAHGGELRVHSAPGGPTTFDIVVPIDVVAAALPLRDDDL